MQTVKIIHFNDVYHIQEQTHSRDSHDEATGGISRFATALKSYRQTPNQALVCFSGDVFSPSLESSFSSGEMWPPLLNILDIDVACLGNHDFDYGLTQLEKLKGMCAFPWLLSNIVDSKEGTQRPVVGALPFHIQTAATDKVVGDNVIRVGFIGLAEPEWLATIPNLPSYVTYLPFIEQGRKLARHLKSEMGCRIVIALTHMRLPNDLKLAENVQEIDLVLGGHDHFYKVHAEATGGLIRVVKSGSDFMDFSYITLTLDNLVGGIVDTLGDRVMSYKSNVKAITCERVSVTKRFAPHPELQQMVKEIESKLSESLSMVLFETSTPLDARTSTSRTQETNLGSLVADIMREWYGTDLSVLVGGTIRADRSRRPKKLRNLNDDDDSL